MFTDLNRTVIKNRFEKRGIRTILLKSDNFFVQILICEARGP